MGYVARGGMMTMTMTMTTMMMMIINNKSGNGSGSHVVIAPSTNCGDSQVVVVEVRKTIIMCQTTEAQGDFAILIVDI